MENTCFIPFVLLHENLKLPEMNIICMFNSPIQ